MIALVDANNFYASCQRAFDPSLEGKPVIVLSNGDGCVVARSNESKSIGVTMGAPYFQLEELIREHDIQVFSSNYTLYGDMSARLISVLGRFVENVEVNSIDEAFLDLTGYEQVYPNLVAFARNLRSTVQEWLGLPVSVGIAPTKSLTKVANWYAKRLVESEGVVMLDTPEQIDEVLADYSVKELWGVGRRYASLLKRNDITTAAQFIALPDDWIRSNMTVDGLRLAYELRGRPCRMLDTESPVRKSFCAAPSFGQTIPDKDTITQALLTYLARVAERLRKQHTAARVMTVFLHTNRFRKSPNGEPAKQYFNSQTIQLPHATSSTPELAHYAAAALNGIFRFGYAYQKVGVILSDFVPEGFQEPGLFTELPDERLSKLSQVMDRVNARHGRDKVRLAGQGYDPAWHMKQQWVSPCYTTRWKEILTAH